MRRMILARKDIGLRFLACLGGPRSAPEGPRGPKVPMEGESGATEGLMNCLPCVCLTWVFLCERGRSFLNSAFASGFYGLSTGSPPVASEDRASGLQKCRLLLGDLLPW